MPKLCYVIILKLYFKDMLVMIAAIVFCRQLMMIELFNMEVLNAKGKRKS